LPRHDDLFRAHGNAPGEAESRSPGIAAAKDG